MPKYILLEEAIDSWGPLCNTSYFKDGDKFYNTIEAAVDAARIISGAYVGGTIAVAEVVKRFTAEVSIREVKVK